MTQLPESRVGQAAVGGFRVAAIALLVPIGIIHQSLAHEYGIGVSYIGLLFHATFVATLVAAIGIAVGVRGSWILGLLTSAGAIAGLVTASTIGLPNFTESFQAPKAMTSLVLEAGFVVLFAVAAAIRPRVVFGMRALDTITATP